MHFLSTRVNLFFRPRQFDQTGNISADVMIGLLKGFGLQIRQAFTDFS